MDATMRFLARFRLRYTYYDLYATLGAPQDVPKASFREKYLTTGPSTFLRTRSAPALATFQPPPPFQLYIKRPLTYALNVFHDDYLCTTLVIKGKCSVSSM